MQRMNFKHAVRLDQKSKNRKPWYWLRRTQPGRISEYRRRKPAAEEADQSIGKRKQMPKRNEWVFGGCSGFFRCQPSEIGKEQRLMYIAIRTDDGRNIGKISFYCSTLQVSRQAFYDYLERKGKPWKYQPLADAMLKIHDEDEENADYGRVRMYQALKYRKEVCSSR